MWHSVFEIKSVEMEHWNSVHSLAICVSIRSVNAQWHKSPSSSQWHMYWQVYTFNKVNKVTSLLRLIPRPVHNQMPNVSNISALPQLCLTNTWERSPSLSAVFGSNNSAFLVTLYLFMPLCSLSCTCFHLSPSKLPCHLFLVVPWHFPDTTW